VQSLQGSIFFTSRAAIILWGRRVSQWWLFVSHLFRLFVYKTQTSSYYHFCAVQIAYNSCILFHMMTEGNHDLCGGVTELHVLCGK